MLLKNCAWFSALFLLLFTASCDTSKDKPDSETATEKSSDEKEDQKNDASPVSHQKWDKLVKDHVNEQGMINYKGMKQNEAQLDEYLALISKTPVKKDEWTKVQQMAYWINAYNAYTVKLILNHYPLKSIKNIKSQAETPWDISFFEIGGKKYNLNEIEHGILRKQFETDPRYHFALVCAAMSCPRLRTEAYVPEKLDEQLNDQGKIFMATKSKNEIMSADKATISPYFDWYAKDFQQGDATVVSWGNEYSETKLNKGAKITYMDYDWSLNEQKK